MMFKKAVDFLHWFFDLSGKCKKGLWMCERWGFVKDTEKLSVVKDELDLINFTLFFTVALEKMLKVRLGSSWWFLSWHLAVFKFIKMIHKHIFFAGKTKRFVFDSDRSMFHHFLFFNYLLNMHKYNKTIVILKGNHQ